MDYQYLFLLIHLKGAYQILLHKMTLQEVKNYTISLIVYLLSARVQKITMYGISNNLR